MITFDCTADDRAVVDRRFRQGREDLDVTRRTLTDGGIRSSTMLTNRFRSKLGQDTGEDAVGRSSPHAYPH